MKEIPLTKGFVALVDDEDYEKVRYHKWQALTGGRKRKWVYAKTDIGHRCILMHRFILGDIPGVEYDHKDGNGINNQKANLRRCRRGQNNANHKPWLGSRSKYKGLYLHPQNKRWVARITVNKKKRSLGCYATELEAAAAYDRAARKLNGEFALLNCELYPKDFH